MTPIMAVVIALAVGVILGVVLTGPQRLLFSQQKRKPSMKNLLKEYGPDLYEVQEELAKRRIDRIVGDARRKMGEAVGDDDDEPQYSRKRWL